MVYLNDITSKQTLQPFTLTRHTANIRVGILTIKQKWELLLGENVSLVHIDGCVNIPANIIPTLSNYKQILQLASQQKVITNSDTIKSIQYPWHITQLCDYAINEDYRLLTSNKQSQSLSQTNTTINPSNIFVSENASIEHCILNASAGPIYIDKGATVQEGSIIRGPFYLGKNATVKMGAKIYGATSIGNNCIVGGEIKNSTIFDYSNKSHDGYLGDSVLGSWCNLGAGTSNSNIKNTAGNIKIQLSADTNKINAGIKAGLFMGEYSRAAINTSFTTGTVVGVCCNVFGNSNPPKYINNFTWGNEQYDFNKAVSHIQNWMQLKNETISNEQIETLKNLYSHNN
jgi:UDP-N-acetylglucosamine diphosphorylase / glucose-1-phosphate thymidylyltransferase / UDP-N-acetylgalactosamine diphosphorylase / glucosamine-1-phosphate N-acetyltransferase / galactosamine-1-phosphate N-acetyltransferase